MKLLDLFSGIGGFSLGLERAGFETIAFCEIEDYPRKVLAKHWPNVPIAGDIRKLTYINGELIYDGQTIYRGTIDAICGGFPCQDLSVAGKQKGIHAERSGLWGEYHRLIGEIRPKYTIVENVTALLSGDSGRWFQRVLGDLAEIGYDCEWHCIPAHYAGLNQFRDRVWVVANPKEINVEQMVSKEGLSCKFRRVGRENVSRARWPVDSTGMGGGVDGVSPGVDRFEGLGNAVVPQIPELIGRAIMKLEAEKASQDKE